ncbi:MAG: hypothetical protein ACJ77E_16980 [Gaiellaceae bacterium]
MTFLVHIDDEPDEAPAGELLHGALSWALDSGPAGSSWLVGNWDDVRCDPS